MATLIYYVAMSVDGFIADKNGGVGWLETLPQTGEDYGYGRFYANTDALIMGRNTYQQVLDFGQWPYPDKPTWVMTSQSLTSERDDIMITHQSPTDVMADLHGRGLEHIWLVGGGMVAKAFHDQALITDYIISVIPRILGAGIPLFALGTHETPLTLTATETYKSGVVQMVYKIMNNKW